MMLPRTPHWDTREFNAWILKNEKRPFEWGVFDCCLAAADGIESFTGVDLASAFRGKYTDEASALVSIVSTTGGTSVEDAIAWCAAQAGLMEWSGAPRCAQRGDLVLLSGGDTMHGGVVHTNGRHCITAGLDGLRRYPLSAVKRAWKV